MRLTYLVRFHSQSTHHLTSSDVVQSEDDNNITTHYEIVSVETTAVRVHSAEVSVFR